MKTQFLEVYRVGETIVGRPMRGVTGYQCRLEYGNCFSFPGKTACFFLASHDWSITKDEALDFCVRCTQGKMIVHHIDLSELTVKREVYKHE